MNHLHRQHGITSPFRRRCGSEIIYLFSMWNSMHIAMLYTIFTKHIMCV